MAHEMTHVKQQKSSQIYAIWWWIKYLTIKEFRLSQEIEAYRNQYKSYCLSIKDRNLRLNYLMNLAMFLSSPMYGNMIPYNKAIDTLK